MFWNRKRCGSDEQGRKIIKPVFIIGCGRSGTTLLFDLLAQHPGLTRTKGYPDGEDHEGWVKYGGCVMAGLGNVHSGRFGSGINGYQACLHMDEHDVMPMTAARMRDYYYKDVLKENPAGRVINKNPHLSNKLRYVLEIFPDAKFVHVIRRCEPMVASWLAAVKDLPSPVVYWPEEEYPCLWLLNPPQSEAEIRRLARHKRFFPGGGAALFIDYWVKTNENIQRQLKQGEAERQLTLLRYEDLIQNPGKELSRLTEFCELPPYAFDVSKVSSSQTSKHQHLITAELRKQIQSAAGGTIRHYGYQV